MDSEQVIQRTKVEFGAKGYCCWGVISVQLDEGGKPFELAVETIFGCDGTTAAAIKAVFAVISVGLTYGASFQTLLDRFDSVLSRAEGGLESAFALAMLCRRLGNDYGSKEFAPVDPKWVEWMPHDSEAPYCYVCHVVMLRAEVGYVCLGCGTTSGCS